MPASNSSRWIFSLGVTALAVALPMWVDSYMLYIANVALSYVIVAAGLNILLGFSGQFAFANAAFMGIGAYATALLTGSFGIPYLVALPLAGCTAAILGLATSFPAMRMRSVYLAMVSLAFAELVQWVLIHWKSVTAGTDGLSVPIMRNPALSLTDDQTAYMIILPVVVLCMLVIRRLLYSKLGRAFVAIRENEIVARCNGIDVSHYKMLAFALSAFFAGIGGSLYALAIRFIVPDGFGMLQLVLHFSIVVIGGLGSLLGSTIGAIALTVMPEVLRGLQALQEIIYGVLLVVFVIFMPSGIAGILYSRGWIRRRHLIALRTSGRGARP